MSNGFRNNKLLQCETGVGGATGVDARIEYVKGKVGVKK